MDRSNGEDTARSGGGPWFSDEDPRISHLIRAVRDGGADGAPGAIADGRPDWTARAAADRTLFTTLD